MSQSNVTKILEAVSEKMAFGQGSVRKGKTDYFDSTVFVGGKTYRVRVAWPDGLEAHELAPEIVALTYVRTIDGLYLVQVPDETAFGFSLCDDEQSWPGGFGIASEWTAVTPDEVPMDVRERLAYLLNV